MILISKSNDPPNDSSVEMPSLREQFWCWSVFFEETIYIAFIERQPLVWIHGFTASWLLIKWLLINCLVLFLDGYSWITFKLQVYQNFCLLFILYNPHNLNIYHNIIFTFSSLLFVQKQTLQMSRNPNFSLNIPQTVQPSSLSCHFWKILQILGQVSTVIVPVTTRLLALYIPM